MCINMLNPLYYPEVACAFTLCEDQVKGEGNRKSQSRKSKADSCLTLIERKRICLPWTLCSCFLHLLLGTKRIGIGLNFVCFFKNSSNADCQIFPFGDKRGLVFRNSAASNVRGRQSQNVMPFWMYRTGKIINASHWRQFGLLSTIFFFAWLRIL